MQRNRWASALAALSLVLGTGISVTSLSVATATAASATTCSYSGGDGGSGYYYAGYLDLSGTYGYTGVEGDINYPSGSDDITLTDDDTQHGLAYVGNGSRNDPNLDMIDWLQVGFALGEFDGDSGTTLETSTVQVYSEAQWPTEPVNPDPPYNYEPKVTFYGSDNLGNDLFKTSYTDETSMYDGYTYGIYNGYYDYGSGFVGIGTSYLFYPTKTQIVALIEASDATSGEACPDFSDGTDGGILFGTEGSSSNPAFDANSTLRFQDAYGDSWTNWTSSTENGGSEFGDSPYSVDDNYDTWAAWQANGK